MKIISVLCFILIVVEIQCMRVNIGGGSGSSAVQPAVQPVVDSDNSFGLYSNETCFDNGVCVDLTSFAGNNKSRTLFYSQCEYWFQKIYGYSCSYQFSQYNAQVSSNSQVEQWEGVVDVFALWVYTRFYKEVNNGLRDQSSTKKVDSDFYWLDIEMSAGLVAIASLSGNYTHLTWRSESNSIQDYHVGHGYTCLFFMSTSYDRDFAWNWGHANKDVFLVVYNSGGRDINNISPWEDQSEVLIPAGYNYQILLIKNVTNAWWMTSSQVFMYQVDSTTVHYDIAQRYNLLQWMIKEDKINSLLVDNLTPSQIKYIIKMKNERRIPTSQPPSSWKCDKDWYNTNDGCDCNCGVWDPDCDSNSTELDIYAFGSVLNCNEGASPVCDRQTAQCIYSAVPKEWTCSATHYNTSDGCDCGCGIRDPDCDGTSSGSPVLTHCNQANPVGCSVTGQCLYVKEIPEEWTCDKHYYGSNDGCDCNCGVLDPDCHADYDSYNGLTLNCPCQGMSCSAEGTCVGTCDSE